MWTFRFNLLFPNGKKVYWMERWGMRWEQNLNRIAVRKCAKLASFLQDIFNIHHWFKIVQVFGLHLVLFDLSLPGGCEGKLKPCTADVCAGIQHAYCDSQLGVCLCKPGYEPLYDHHQLLQCSVYGQTTADDSGTQHKTGTAASIIPSHQATASEDKIQSRYYYPRK